MKYILVIGDGMADNALPELDGKTPLEHADTPFMDSLAGAGVLGRVRTIPEGVPPGSDTATLSIFGCDPVRYYSGRAPIEAAASGIELAQGDVAYRCNMVTLGEEEEPDKPLEDKHLISHSAGGIESGVSDMLVRSLFNTPEFKKKAEAADMEIYPGGSFRHIAVQRAGACTPVPDEITLIPPHDHLGEKAGLLLPEGSEILTDLMRIAHKVLDIHPVNKQRRSEGKLPANGIWFWAQGMAAKLPCFGDMYKKTGSVVSAVPNCRGIGALMGLTSVTVPGATGELNTNYEGKAEAALKELETKDFVAVHIEAPDECTHDGDLKGKLRAIEWIDSRVIAPVLHGLQAGSTGYRMLVLSDHKTLISTRGHDGGPVPFILYDSREDKKTGLQYNETHAGQGIYIDDGTKLMEMLFNDV